ncbi:MAG: hypothetical protein A2W19_08150 [Spirochaetes bacterium RBG_16_49_21]|nr:MAG: hypothetical protein A2W19_08150 [Spirochaetes bacterium RBG_16_49_21]
MKKGGILFIFLFISITISGLCLVLDYNGKYTRLPTVTDPWCGKSIEIRKIRFNAYRITWELITGERSVLELIGNVNGDTLDFRKGKGKEMYGYTYALTSDKKGLIVTLTVPDRKVVCQFVREKGE